MLEIASDGSYKLNSQAIPRSSLHDRLLTVFTRRSERVLFLKAAGTLDFAVVVEAIDTAREATVDRVALMPR